MPRQKVYAHLDQIPSGRAVGGLVHGCLVLEGGAFRGLYTQGLLDALMQNGVNLDCVVGVSAGALSGMSYVSGQVGYSARVNLGYRHDGRYVGLRALVHSGSPLDLGFLTEDRGVIEPLDLDAFNNPARRFIAVATSCETGRPVAFEKGRCQDIRAAVRASASMPFMSPMVRVEGGLYLDGGCSCKIPYQWALDAGYDKIVVVRTRDAAFRKPAKAGKLAKRVYRKYPAFAQSLSESNISYNEQVEQVEDLHKQGRLLRLAPSEPVTVGQIEGDMDKLGALYWLGHRDCLDRLGQVKAYLGI